MASVAIVHDYLNQPGGAERVVLEMAKIWPKAPIFTSLFRPGSTHDGFRELDVRTTFLDRLPVDRRFRALTPLFPLAFRTLGELDAEVVISSSSAWAHSVRTADRSLHVVYCYAPPRWIHAPEAYFGNPAVRTAVRPVAAWMRRWDERAARGADAYIVIAENVRQRVRAAYGIDSDVVYPPVDTARFSPRPRGERFLVISRLLAYKRVDLVVRAATAIGAPLDVVGTGPAMSSLRALAGPTVTFHGHLCDADVTAMIEQCSAVCFPGTEDFGLVPVEANAAGKPVVAFAAGGALETLEDGFSAAFFREPSVEAVTDAMRGVQALEADPEALARSAERFSRRAFAENLVGAIARIRERARPR